MPIPSAELAYVPPEKIADYLLNELHPIGGGKAKWFFGFGYDAANPIVLDQDLCQLVGVSEDYTSKNSPFGIKYVVSGKITTPSGLSVNVTTVWIVEPSEIRPRLVTAYPGDKS